MRRSGEGGRLDERIRLWPQAFRPVELRARPRGFASPCAQPPEGARTTRSSKRRAQFPTARAFEFASATYRGGPHQRRQAGPVSSGPPKRIRTVTSSLAVQGPLELPAPPAEAVGARPDTRACAPRQPSPAAPPARKRSKSQAVEPIVGFQPPAEAGHGEELGRSRSPPAEQARRRLAPEPERRVSTSPVEVSSTSAGPGPVGSRRPVPSMSLHDSPSARSCEAALTTRRPLGLESRRPKACVGPVTHEPWSQVTSAAEFRRLPRPLLATPSFVRRRTEVQSVRHHDSSTGACRWHEASADLREGSPKFLADQRVEPSFRSPASTDRRARRRPQTDLRVATIRSTRALGASGEARRVGAASHPRTRLRTSVGCLAVSGFGENRGLSPTLEMNLAKPDPGRQRLFVVLVIFL